MGWSRSWKPIGRPGAPEAAAANAGMPAKEKRQWAGTENESTPTGAGGLIEGFGAA